MLNHVIIQGNLIADPELKTKNGVETVHLSILSIHNPDPSNNRGDTIPVTFRDGLAKFVARTFKKGDNITLQGRVEGITVRSKTGVFTKLIVHGYEVFPGFTAEAQANGQTYEHAMQNIAIVQGNLVADPEVSKTGKNASVANVILACKRDYDKDGQDADFIRITFWDNQADYIAKHWHKGDNVTVSGRLREIEYNTRDGKKITKLEVRANYSYPGVTQRMRELLRQDESV